jgi:peptidoglycan/LPS O-acetylase OafA/YrhL
VYLFHLPVAHVLAKVVPGGAARFAPFSGIALIALLIVFSVIAERVYDRPFRAWLRAGLVDRWRTTAPRPPQRQRARLSARSA